LSTLSTNRLTPNARNYVNRQHIELGQCHGTTTHGLVAFARRSLLANQRLVDVRNDTCKTVHMFTG